MGAALTLIKPGLYTDIIGFGLLALVVALQLLIKRKKNLQRLIRRPLRHEMSFPRESKYCARN